MSIMGGMETKTNGYYRHRRRNSSEVDVFEAARYFSGAPEPHIYVGAANSQRPMKEERAIWEGRKSTDVYSSFPAHAYKVNEQHSMIKEKKSKLPISPGGKLASFLNSLFSQSSSKKKSKSSSQSIKDEEESPGGRKKRRSSISHFQGFVNSRSKSLYSSSMSQTPTKAYKDKTGHLYEQARSVPSFSQNEVCSDRKHRFTSEFSEKDKIGRSNEMYLEKERTMCCKFSQKKGILEGDRTWVDEVSSQKNFRRFEEVDDGGDSDSSSDLFDLPNYVLGVYSNGLPVYETTHMENINIRAT